MPLVQSGSCAVEAVALAAAQGSVRVAKQVGGEGEGGQACLVRQTLRRLPSSAPSETGVLDGVRKKEAGGETVWLRCMGHG